jgi:hypothetical protein
LFRGTRLPDTGRKLGESSEENRRDLIKSSLAQYLAEMPQFILNLFGTRNRMRDFFSQQLAVPLPHPLHGRLDGRLRHMRSAPNWA